MLSKIIIIITTLFLATFLPSLGKCSEALQSAGLENAPILGLISGRNSPKNITAFMTQLNGEEAFSITQVLQRKSDFRPITNPIINESFKKTTQWYAFKVRNTSDIAGKWHFATGIRTPQLLRFFEHKERQVTTIFEYHGNGPYDQRSIDHRHLFAEIQLEAGEEKEIFIQLEKMSIRMIPRLITLETKTKEQLYDYCWIIFFLTCLGTLLVTNFSQYIATKNSLYLYYCSAVFWSALSVTHHDGYHFRFLFPNYPFIDYALSYYVGVPTALSILQVIRKALCLRENSPTLDRLVLASMAGWLASIPATIMFNSAAVVEFMSLFICPFTLCVLVLTGYTSIKHKVPSAYFYLAGWLCYGIGLSCFVLIHSDVNLFTWLTNSTHVYAAGILLEGFLFYFGLAYQMHVIQSREEASRLTAMQLLEEKISDMESVAKVESEKKQIQEQSLKNSMQFASASHDMHQPLFTIRAVLASIKDDLTDKSVMKEIDSAFEYLNQILNATLTNSRSQLNQSNARIDLENLFKELFSRHIHAARSKGLTLRLATTTATITGSRIILARIIDNLVRNAIAYTQYGKVLVGMRRRAKGVELQVLDTGIGIAKSDLERLTLPFERGKSTAVSSQHNFGLGLAITKMLCKQQGYSFSIQSMVGRGSIFSIYIPYAI